MERKWLIAAKDVLDELTNCEVSPSELVTLEVTLEALTATLEQAFFGDQETVYGLSDLLSQLKEEPEYDKFIGDDLPSRVSELVEECSKAHYWEDKAEMPSDLKERLAKCHGDLAESVQHLLDAAVR